ncbi:hypothetical protein [Draconibacterium sp.]|uniref:hypothetical protein n=1 Tax=Draconibacterium sp. TaxID=1965318 RepID=UPI003561E0C4
MTYKILESHCVFENEKLKEVAVLWDDNGFVRATYSTLDPRAGYANLSETDGITPKLLQRVAGGGSYVDEARRKKYFPGKRNWSR